jgi:M6 family metalloprotease-like protein
MLGGQSSIDRGPRARVAVAPQRQPRGVQRVIATTVAVAFLGLVAAQLASATSARHTPSARDTTPPSVPKVRGPRRTPNHAPTFRFRSIDHGTPTGKLRYRCAFDSRHLHACRPIYRQHLTTRRHLLRVRAQDRAGNTSRITTVRVKIIAVQVSPPAPPPPPPVPPPPPPAPLPPPLLEGAPCSPQLTQNADAAANERAIGYPFLNEGPTTVDGSMSSKGSAHAIVIAVDFSDVPHSGDAQSLGDTVVSQLSYFDEASYGRFSASAKVLAAWYRMPHPTSDYGSWFNPLGGAHDIVADATAAADADVDFSQYQFVYLLMPHFPQSGNPAWLVFPGHGVVRDGTELRHATFLSEGFTEGARVAYIANHELTHSLGLPDLYYETDSTTHTAAFDAVGMWDPMSEPGPRHYLAWHKWKLGWLDPAQVACVPAHTTVSDTVSPLERAGGLKMVVAQTSPSTAYVVETRRRLGIDSGLCDEGVLIYTVDSQVANARGAVRVKRATPDGSAQSSCGLLYAAPFSPMQMYEDAAVKVEVLSLRPDGSYDLRVTRK